MVAEMHFLEQVCIMFLDGFPTVNRTFIRHLNRALSVKRGNSGGIVVIPCIVNFLSECEKVLAQLRVGRFYLLAKVGKAKLIASPTKASGKRIFIVFSREFRLVVA
jgi:hypothetical protein